MPEPTSSTMLAGAAALAPPALAVPILTILGIPLGLRADVLMAGFCGAIAAISLLNTVPSTGDTWRELLRTSVKRVGVSVGSAVLAGYVAPILALVNGIPDPMILGMAFIAGAGAPQILPWLIQRFSKGGGQ